ncbi:alpha/beta hydrolase [soil metagenome]
MRSLMLIAAALLAAYVAWLALLYVGQRSMMFPGAGLQVDAGRYPLAAGAEAVAIPAAFGQVRGYFLPAASPGREPAVVYFHGNAELAVQNIALLQPLADLGLHVLVVEYPGYAGSDGRPGRGTLDEAARVGFDWLAQRADVDPARIVAMGRSIGAGPAVALAPERPVAALVLLSAFSSLDGFAHGMGAPAFLLRDRWDNAAGLRDYKAPVLLFHGRRDRIIHFAHSRALAQAAPHARLEALDCGHNDCPYFEPAFVITLEQFLRDGGILARR